MPLDRNDPVIRRLAPENVDHLESEGWTLTPDGARFIKTRPDGNPSEIPWENVRDWPLEVLKDMIAPYPAHTVADLRKK
jgi:hypothetical protein